MVGQWMFADSIKFYHVPYVFLCLCYVFVPLQLCFSQNSSDNGGESQFFKGGDVEMGMPLGFKIKNLKCFSSRV